MNFEQSLFISYAHMTINLSTQDQKGWITRFMRP